MFLIIIGSTCNQFSWVNYSEVVEVIVIESDYYRLSTCRHNILTLTDVKINISFSIWDHMWLPSLHTDHALILFNQHMFSKFTPGEIMPG